MRTRILATLAALPLVLVFAGCTSDPGVPDDLDMPQTGEDLFVGNDAESIKLAESIGFERVSTERPELLVGAGDLTARRVNIHQRGATDRFAQSINGVPVFGGELVVNLDRRGKLLDVYDYLKKGIKIDTNPAVVELDARKAAYAHIEGVVSRDVGTDLQILPLENGDVRLTYRVQLEGTNLDGEPSMPVVFVDAQTGEVVFSYDNLQTGKSWKTYTTNNSTSLPGTLVLTNGAGTSSDNVLKTADANASLTYDFYLSKFGRDSYNGAGATITSTTHYSTNYVNAYWDGKQMVYGDGNGVDSSPLVVLDVVGHELTHAVTSSESNLTYSNESGALNEAMSDIFGAAIQAYRDGAVTTNTWWIGEECWTPGTPNDALRYMNDPAKSGSDYDYYPTRYTGTSDNGGVHSNSGIANLAFYLAVMGGQHPRGKTTNVVPALNADPMTSLDMGARIFYDANANRLGPSSSFSDMRTATVAAATALYGASAAASIAGAWTAVGVIEYVWTQVDQKTSLSGAKSSKTYYTYSVPAGAKKMKFTTSGGTGDLDLYVRNGTTKPTTLMYNCMSGGVDTNESCTLDVGTQTKFTIMLSGYTAFSGVTLTVSAGQ